MTRTSILNLSVLTLILPLAGCSAFIPEVRIGDLQGLAKFEKPGDTLDTNQWTSLSKDVQFLPVLEQKQRLQQHQHQQQVRGRERRLRKLDEEEDMMEEAVEYNPYNLQPFNEALSDYNQYQQAWRMLGFMIDCDTTDGESRQYQSHDRSGDEGVQDDGCVRFVVWAAVSIGK
jgi:hypothetical protein